MLDVVKSGVARDECSDGLGCLNRGRCFQVVAGFSIYRMCLGVVNFLQGPTG